MPNSMDASLYSSVTVKTCAVVQGNIRKGTDEVLAFLVRHFDAVILSTWDDEPPERLPLGDWDLVRSRKPAVAGYSHRNFQRLTTAAGLRRAEEIGATHVLKWRTDMLPTKLDVQQLLEWSRFNVPTGMESRLVTGAFRNLTVKDDWFSTMPDLFAFGDISLMKTLWGDDSFDYTVSANVPVEMLAETGSQWLNRPDVAGLYCAEAELYAIFKSRLQRKLGTPLTHVQIARNCMRLIDHLRLGICWFGESQQFRSINQALQHPWWTEKTWESGKPRVSDLGYPDSGLRKSMLRKYLTPWVIRCELNLQLEWYARYTNSSVQLGAGKSHR